MSIDIANGTIASVLAAARHALTQHAQHLDGQHSESHLEAEILLRDTLGCSRAWLFAHSTDPMPRHALAPFIERLHARAEGSPIAYITGEREFWSLPLSITADVLIPRADTELLVECALALLPVDAPRTIFEPGTGSGAVALAIASERPLARVIASDFSRAAVHLAQRNARQLAKEMANNAPVFITAHWLAAIGNKALDLLVSNPPYIRNDDPHLEQGDLRFEPRHALASGNDGLSDLRVLIEQAPRCLRSGGWIALEHGHDLGAAVRELLLANRFASISTRTDLAGHERVSLGARA